MMDYRQVIQKGVDYIEENLRAEISAAELSQQAGFSLFYYYRLFQSVVGMPVKQYILRRRLLWAIYEIRGGRKRIDAALEYGFETYAGFYKAFLREFGSTPSAYLKQNRAVRPGWPDFQKEEYQEMTNQKDVLAHWGLAHEAVSNYYYEGSGEQNPNMLYVGEDYVLKRAPRLSQVQTCIALFRAIEEAGLYAATPTPTLDGHDYVVEGGQYYYLMRRMSGRQMVAREFYEPGGMTRARFTGEIIGQLHLALARMEVAVDDVDLYGTVKDWALPKARACLTLPEEFCQTYMVAFAELYPQLPRQIIHRDPNPSNIIVSQNQWGFVDFDLSERNVRLYDPCYAATAILSETFAEGDEAKLQTWLELYQNILAGYDSIAHLSDAERRAAPYVVMANQLVCVAWFAEHVELANVYEVNRRMTQWMVSHFDALRLR